MLCFTEGILASPEWSEIIRITPCSLGSSIPLGQSGRTDGCGNSPTSSTCGSEVDVVMNDSTLRDLAGHEADLRLRPKMCVLVSTDSALHDADADPDEEGPGDDCVAREGLRVCPGHGVCWFV